MSPQATKTCGTITYVTPRYTNDSFYSKILERKLLLPNEHSEHAIKLRTYLTANATI
jgi:hypothetical protein